MCVSLNFFLWGAHWAPRPLECMVLPVDRFWLEVIYVLPGMTDIRELSGVLHGRVRQCGALSGVLAEFAAFLSRSA